MPNETIQWYTEEMDSKQLTDTGFHTCFKKWSLWIMSPSTHWTHCKEAKTKATKNSKLGRKETKPQYKKALKPRSAFTTNAPKERPKQKSRLQTAYQPNQKHQTLKLLQTVSLLFIEKDTKKRCLRSKKVCRDSVTWVSAEMTLNLETLKLKWGRKGNSV